MMCAISEKKSYEISSGSDIALLVVPGIVLDIGYSSCLGPSGERSGGAAVFNQHATTVRLKFIFLYLTEILRSLL